jgi:hypothetical protein
MSREAAEIANQSERPCSFGERRLRNVWSNGSGASVLSCGHGSMVASLIFNPTTPPRNLAAYAEEFVSKSTFTRVSS